MTLADILRLGDVERPLEHARTLAPIYPLAAELIRANALGEPLQREETNR